MRNFEMKNQERMSFVLHISYHPKSYPFAKDGIVPNQDTASHITVVLGTKDISFNVTDRFETFTYLEFIGFDETGEIAVIKKDLRKSKSAFELIGQCTIKEISKIDPEKSINDFLLSQSN